MTAPVLLFVYSRPNHARRTVEALLKNPEASDTDLIVFSDAAKTQDKVGAVESVRNYIEGIRGFRSVTLHRRSHNFGLAKSIIEGVTDVLRYRDSVIVLEDDMITSPHFLAYMNSALIRYENNENVISIHGYVYPVRDLLPETFFLPGADCWGWATWRRGWALFNPDGQFLLDELGRRNLVNAFDFNGAFKFSKMLKEQISGGNDSWAIRWHASAFIANKLTLYPGRSLVQNIGNDGTGTHCGTDTVMDVNLASSPIDLRDVPIEPSAKAAKAIERFFRTRQSYLKRIAPYIKRKDHYSELTRFAKGWLPPALIVLLRKILFRKAEITFEGPFASWDAAMSRSSGYDSPHILDTVLASALKVKNGEAVFERDAVLFDKITYSWPITSALMWSAARCGGCLSVLDFGGSLGTSYFQNRKLLEGLQSVSWSVVEQPHFAKAGREHIEDEQLRFYSTVTDCMSEQKPNVVLLSSVLQYLEDPYSVLEQLIETDAEIILIDRTPFLLSGKSDIFKVQINPKSINLSRYPIRYFCYDDFTEWFYCRGFRKVEEFPALDKLDYLANWRGLIFVKGDNVAKL